jgi:hypothetical protein
MPRRLLLPLSILLALAASACQVRTTVDVAMAEDGSGEVAVTVRLDAEALARVPDVDDDGTSGLADLATLVRTEDLVAAGWSVGEPAESGEGGAALRITRPFGTPDEADTILAELTGPAGALRDLDVSRSTSFGRTELGFSGTADLSGGLEAFGDEGLAAALDGEPLGQDAAAIEAAAGVPLAEAVMFEITADLDGDATSWEPRLGDPPVVMAAETTAYDAPVVALTAVAVVAALALVAVLLIRLARSRRRA